MEASSLATVGIFGTYVENGTLCIKKTIHCRVDPGETWRVLQSPGLQTQGTVNINYTSSNTCEHSWRRLL